MTSNGTQTYLAQYFTDMADWHSRVKREPADGLDGGSDASAGFYRALAAHIRGLPEDDLRLVALSRLTGLDEQHDFSPGPRVSAAIAEVNRFLDGSPEPFLEHLVHAALDDQLDTRPHASGVLLESLEFDDEERLSRL